MPLATPIIAEQKIPALIIAHLVARRSDADYPTPGSSDLTLVAGPVKDTTKRSHPSLEVWCPSFTLPFSRDVQEVDVMLDLHADPSDTITEDMTRLALIRRALAGGPFHAGANATNSSTNPFLAYLNGLSDNDSAGWEVQNFYITSGSVIIEDTRRVIFRTEAKCLFRSYALGV